MARTPKAAEDAVAKPAGSTQGKKLSRSIPSTGLPVVDVLNPILSEVKDEGTRKALLAIVAKQESYKGMLPHPDHAERFEVLLPGTFNRLIQMSEREQDHRHYIQRKQIEGEHGIRSRGQWFAMFGLLVLLAAALWLIFTGHAQEGSIILGGTLVSVVAAFLGYQYLSSKKPKAKLPATPPTT
jgi:uncharacterized membrane protein